MSCKLTCTKCGATCTGNVVEDDPDTNSFVAEPTYPNEWDGGDVACPHEQYEVSEIDRSDPFWEYPS